MGVAPPLDSMRIEEKTKPVVIETDAIFAIGMLSSLPPIHVGLILATLSGEISIRVAWGEVDILEQCDEPFPIRFPVTDRCPTSAHFHTYASDRGPDLVRAGRKQPPVLAA